MPHIPSYGRNIQLKELEAMWAPIYENILTLIGSTGTVLAFGDPHHGQPDATTFTTVGEEQVTFTWSEAPNSFDTKLDLTDADSFQNVIPIVTFNGTDEEADSPDAAYWSRVSGAFSVSLWVRPTSGSTTGDSMLSKFDTGADTREWVINRSSGAVRFILVDESVSANPEINTIADSALTANVWTFVVCTADGTADASGLNIYENGVLVASTDSDDAAFVAMEDLGGTVKLAHINATPTSLFTGKMAGGPLGPFFTQTELSADAVRRLYEVGRRAMGL